MCSIPFSLLHDAPAIIPHLLFSVVKLPVMPPCSSDSRRGILLEKTHAKFGEELIFVAGTRVTSDPFAIPFSMGRNLLCIHSKKYIDTPIEKKHEKLMHNKRTMERMVDLLNEDLLIQTYRYFYQTQ